jgi:DNA-binding response OmpR family regulator
MAPNDSKGRSRPGYFVVTPSCQGGLSGERPAALLVSHDPDDREQLKPLFHAQKWKLHTAPSHAAAQAALQRHEIPVVVAERDLPSGDWKQLLAHTQGLRHRPLLVVASRLADDYLWSEVLNLGGHDVLRKPFRASEVLRVLSHAWCRWGGDPSTTGGLQFALKRRVQSQQSG